LFVLSSFLLWVLIIFIVVYSIACRRLNIYLGGSRANASGMREIMGLLDPDMCEWIKQRSANSRANVSSPEFDVAIGSTHLLTMRLLSLSADSDVDEFLRTKIQSLVVFSGIMMKNLEQKRNDAVKP